MAKKKKQKKSRSSKGLRRWRQLSFGGKLWRILWVSLLAVWGFTIVQVLFCALFNPPLTPLMVKRFFQQVGDPEARFPTIWLTPLSFPRTAFSCTTTGSTSVK